MKLKRDFYGRQESKKRKKHWKKNWAKGKKQQQQKSWNNVSQKPVNFYLLENSV